MVGTRSASDERFLGRLLRCRCDRCGRVRATCVRRTEQVWCAGEQRPEEAHDLCLREGNAQPFLCGALRTSASSGVCSVAGATAAGVCGQRVRVVLSRFGAQTSKVPRKRSIFRLERIIFTPPCMRGALRTSASSGVCSVAGATAAGVCGQRVRVGTVRVGWRNKQQRFLPGERALAREVHGRPMRHLVQRESDF